MLLNKINKDQIMLCDEEDYVECKSHMIYFNIKKKLVIMYHDNIVKKFVHVEVCSIQRNNYKYKIDTLLYLMK